MNNPINHFKLALARKQLQIGLWLGLANPLTTEICAGAGFDWLLIDGEHAPNDLSSIQAQLQAIAAYPATQAIARVPVGHGHVGTALIKQYLDLGVQTILVPMVDTAEQARAIVQAMRYPPQGIRGMAGARASRWGRIANYAQQANEQICVLVQAETQTALDNLDAIAAVEGVDGVFIGPADLSASLGHVGEPDHPQVRSAIEDAFRRIARVGKASGILMVDEGLARHYIELGGLFVAVGTDGNLLAHHSSALAARFKDAAAVPQADR